MGQWCNSSTIKKGEPGNAAAQHHIQITPPWCSDIRDSPIYPLVLPFVFSPPVPISNLCLKALKKIYKLHHLAPLCCTNHLKTIGAPSLWWICGVHMYVQLSLFLATCWQHPNLFVTNNYVYITGKLHASLGHLASKRFLWSSQNAGKPGLLFFFWLLETLWKRRAKKLTSKLTLTPPPIFSSLPMINDWCFKGFYLLSDWNPRWPSDVWRELKLCTLFLAPDVVAHWMDPAENEFIYECIYLSKSKISTKMSTILTRQDDANIASSSTAHCCCHQPQMQHYPRSLNPLQDVFTLRRGNLEQITFSAFWFLHFS